MTVAMDDRLAPKRHRRQAIRMVRQKLAERSDQRAQSLCPRIVGEQILQLVAEDRDAARLEADDRNAFIDFAIQGADDVAQPPLRRVEHAVVVERPSAAQRRARNLHREAAALQNPDRRHCGLWMEMVVEGVGPQDDALTTARTRGASIQEPLTERDGCEGRNAAPWRHTGDE